MEVLVKQLRKLQLRKLQLRKLYLRAAMTITRIDPILYKAAAEGNIMTFIDDNFEHRLEALLTPNKNTILHIFITTLQNGNESSATEFVREILNMCPSLLCQVNVKDETPLHVAARYGHANIVQVLIENARDSQHQDLESGIEAVRKMLRMVNKVRDTALHEAVHYNHLEVMNLLINEDPDFSYSVNDDGETPLYIAAERNYGNLVLEILNTCNSPAYDGPIGRTALHAAVLSKNEVTVNAIMERFGEAITKKADQDDWTPLHLAACSHWSDTCTKLLLKHDSQLAYMKDNEGRTALHIAAQRGKARIMNSIIEMCPDCCELVDNRGWNALHFAVAGDKPHLTVKVILENSSLGNLLNEKNTEADTPLHHHFRSFTNCVRENLGLLNEENTEADTPLHHHSRSFTNRVPENGNLLNEENTEADTPLHHHSRSFTNCVLENLVDHPRVDKMALNKNNHNAYQVALINANNISEEQMRVIQSKLQSYPRRLLKSTKEKRKASEKVSFEKAAEAHLVVAALITTVTFAAAITMPGGFVGTGGEHEGYAVLRRNAAFKAFIITDALSFVLSSSAVSIHLFLPFLPMLFASSEPDKLLREFLFLAFRLILLAMPAMVVAFITGAYAVLGLSSNLGIMTCVIGSYFFIPFYPFITRFTSQM